MAGKRRHPTRRQRVTPEAFLSWFPVVMRYGALLGVFHQAAFARFDRPGLLALYGAMLGLSEIAAALGKGAE